ncbi:MAG TPA: PaaI family thioesterase [Galbitalea sp.]|jgi:uncharacterized protein (TIGR00369 family)
MSTETPPVSERSRVVTWDDPFAAAELAKTMSGMELFEAMLAGKVSAPPIASLMDFQLASAEVGKVVFTCEPNESHYNPIGVVHGGLVCTLLDSVAGCAVHSTLPKGQAYTSLEIKVSYLRPVTVDSGTLTATGIVTKPGRRAAFADATVTDSQGRLVATASSTCLVFPIE